MASWLGGLRSIVGMRDARTAHATEAAELRSALSAPCVDARIVRESRRLLANLNPSTVVLGSAVADPSVQIALDLASLPGSTHVLGHGASGAGKSRLAANACRQVVRAELAGKELGLVMLDPKNELADLTVELVAGELSGVAPADRARFLAGFRYIDPFGSTPVPLNLLAAIPGVPPQIQAFDVSSALGHITGDSMGPNQGTFVHHLVLAAIGRLSLPALYELTADPARLAAFGAQSEHADVRSFFAGRRVAPQAVEGVRSRLHALLRVPAARRCLEASTCLSFSELLANRVTLIATANVPLGCEDVAKLFHVVFATRLGQAILSRRNVGEVPCLVMADEFGETVAAGSYAGTTFERLLNLARSRNVSILMWTQTLAGIMRANPGLAEIVTTNAGVLIGFRSSQADFRIFQDALPVTGRRARPAGVPWEEARAPYLNPAEERSAVLAEAAALAPRLAYYWDRRVSTSAVLIRTADVVTGPEHARLARELMSRHDAPAKRFVLVGGATVGVVREGGRLQEEGTVNGNPAGTFRLMPRGTSPAATTSVAEAARALARSTEPAAIQATGGAQGRGRRRPRRRAAS